MNNGLISVIMGIYNCEATLRSAIDSIIGQTYDNWELILCDDASTDQTYCIAHEYTEMYPDKIILIRNEANENLAYSLNHCLVYSTGEYIARMDGDDISLPERFQIQKEFLDTHLEYDLVGTSMISFDGDNEIGIKAPPPHRPDKYYLRRNAPFAHATIMCRRIVYDRLNGYFVSKHTRRCEDIDFWFRFFEHGFNGYNLYNPLYKVRENYTAFKRRRFVYGIDVFRICFRGFKKLKYPLRYYICLVKPLIASSVPSFIMLKYHRMKDEQHTMKSYDRSNIRSSEL